jgi:hypothetical protein
MATTLRPFVVLNFLDPPSFEMEHKGYWFIEGPAYGQEDLQMRYINQKDSGPMLRYDWSRWMNWKQNDQEDVAIQHKLAFNCRAMLAITGVPFEDAELAVKEVYYKCREEYLATHGWRHLLGEVFGMVWILDLVAAICAAIGSWAYIGTVLCEGIALVLRYQDSQMTPLRDELVRQETALTWLISRGIEPPYDPENPDDIDWKGIVRYASNLQDLEDQGIPIQDPFWRGFFLESIYDPLTPDMIPTIEYPDMPNWKPILESKFSESPDLAGAPGLAAPSSAAGLLAAAAAVLILAIIFWG